QSPAAAAAHQRSATIDAARSPPTFRTAEEYAARVRVRGAVLGMAFAAVAAPAHASSSPCSLATVAQVEAAFGGSVGAGKVDNSLPGAPTCHFQVKGSSLGVAGEAVVFITPG